jgi:formylglycine-generating enzyme required for sulfatase activity
MAAKIYDVFLSHSSADAAEVERLAQGLRAAGLKPFLAVWHLVAGKPWQEGLEEALEQSCCCAVLVGEEGLGLWQNEEMRVALDRHVRDEQYRVIPAILAGDGAAALTGFLGRQHAVVLRDDDPQRRLDVLLRAIVGANPEPGEERSAASPLTQRALKALEEEIASIETLRARMGDTWADGELAKLEGERTALEKQPKIRVRGPRGSQPMPAAAGGGEHAEAHAAYFRVLAKECSALPLGIIDTRFSATVGEDSIPLPDIYVDLDVIAPAEPLGQGEDEQEGGKPDRGRWAFRLVRGEGRDRTPVLAALAGEEHSRAVVLGEAGSGKTTFAHYLAYLLATGSAELPEPLQGLLPVRLILRNVAATHVPADAAQGSASMLWSALQEDLARKLGSAGVEGCFEALRARLLASGGFFLLDGLDEVPEAHRRRRTVLEAVAELAQEVGERSRLLVTARPYAYADPSCQLHGFSTLALAPFDEDQVQRFLARWYQAVRGNLHWSPEAADSRSRELAGAVRERAYLADLASRPLLLTLMATLHSSWGHLPEDRADLYEEIVLLLLSRWQEHRKAVAPSGEEVTEPGISQALQVGEERIRARLEELAFRVHERQRTEEERRDDSADVSETELLVACKPLFESLGPETLLHYLRHRAGLLIARQEGVFAFPHRSFQEYLAAGYLAARPNAAVELRRRVTEDPVWWREVVLMAVCKARQGRLPDAVSLAQALLSIEDDGGGELPWRAASLAGEALVELRLLERAGEDLPDYEAMILRPVRERLVALVEGGHLAPRERLVAADVLGRLGDPRKGVGAKVVGDQSLPDFDWVEVPAGSFEMGSAEGDEDAFDDELPAHRVELGSYFLARYPVTNAQYATFITAGGYQQQDLWSQEGWAWRQGAAADLSVVAEEYRDRFQSWLAVRPVERRDRPYYWGQSGWGAPSRPVVGVTWYEALAFCRWLAGCLRESPGWPQLGGSSVGWTVRLPSEAEWERAARGGQARRWPWGDQPEEGAANLEEAGLGTTHPVGMFPTGANPHGLHDMAGNVWEWSLSRWGRTGGKEPEYRYPYDRRDGREALAGPDLRVIRGGSWYNDYRYARCAVRSWGIPACFFNLVGFRCGVFPG